VTLSDFGPGEPSAAASRPPSRRGRANALCFVIDSDFGFRQEFAKQLRGAGVEALEYSGSARLAENVDEHDPDVVFINVNETDPYDSMCALIALKDCNFSGRVQIIGRCGPKFLESIRNVGLHVSLQMLAGMEKPIEFAAVRRIVQAQKLSYDPVPVRELTLREAISRDRIQFWYQPKIDLRRKQVVGAEVFARLSHPQHGMVAPRHFLAGASDEDRSTLAGQALISALNAGVAFEKMGFNLRFSINIGVEDLLSLPVAELIAKHRSGDDRWPGLILEITERQAINKMAIIKEKYQELKECRVSFAIDSCGRGNSSFSMLSQVPFAEMKIDQSFTAGCGGNKSNARICKAIVETAHAFSMEVTAVGVETPADARELNALGCDIGQGYLYGRPMPEQHFAALIKAVRDDTKDVAPSTAPARSSVAS
jgi:EAL domain-containing protein (putative c-di-GMP-specific phosphodiesterase class I)